MQTAKRSILILLILVTCVGCDQATKAAAKKHLQVDQPIRLLGDVVQLRYTENTGAFLGLGAQFPAPVRFWLLVVLVGLALVSMLAFILTTRDLGLLGTLGGALIVGGGVGNLIDRIAYHGAVIDFATLGMGPLRTGVLNLADVAITTGTVILLANSLRVRGAEEISS